MQLPNNVKLTRIRAEAGSVVILHCPKCNKEHIELSTESDPLPAGQAYVITRSCDECTSIFDRVRGSFKPEQVGVTKELAAEYEPMYDCTRVDLYWSRVVADR